METYQQDLILFFTRYNIIYAVAAFCTLFFVLEFVVKNRSHTGFQYFLLFVLFLALTILFGTRGVSVGADTHNNIKYFTGRVKIRNIGDLNDIGMYTVSMIMTNFTKNVDIFLSVLAVIYILPIFIAIKRFKFINPLIFFFCIFSFFHFRSMGINIQKQGIATSFFLCGLAYILTNRKSIGYLLFGVAFMFHASIILPISVFFLALKIKSVRWPLIIYGLATVLAFINFNFGSILSQIPVINLLVEQRLDTYYEDKGNYRIGFRPDFWLFNTIFTVIGYITLKHIHKFKSEFLENNYKMIFIAYLGLSAFFFLMFSVSFNDRFGVMSWVLMPLILYPYLQTKTSVGPINTLSVYFLCLFLAIAFNFL